MSRTKRYLQRRAVERMPSPVLDLVGKAVLKAVDRAVDERWDRARQMAAEAEGVTVEQRTRSIAKRFRRELAAAGAASGAVAAAPGIGTGAAAGALVADLGWFAMRATDLIMAYGAAQGHLDSTPEERRAWVLSILAFGERAADEFAELLTEVDSGVTIAGVTIGGERVSARLAGLAGSDAATLDALRRVNTSLASTVVSRYGSRRTVLAVGKLLPFGVGAVVGGTANYTLIRVIGSQARKFFASYDRLRPPPPRPGQRALAGPPPALAVGNGQTVIDVPSPPEGSKRPEDPKKPEPPQRPGADR